MTRIGTSNDFGVTSAFAPARLLRLADGPDEVHQRQLENGTAEVPVIGTRRAANLPSAVTTDGSRRSSRRVRHVRVDMKVAHDNETAKR